MLRRCAALALTAALAFSACGCVALVAGAAGGVGTAVWLSGKLSQEVDASVERALSATKLGLQSMGLEITKETITEDITQVRSKYTDDRVVWVDIRRISSARSKLEIRVGAHGDKAAARRIMDQIEKYL